MAGLQLCEAHDPRSILISAECIDAGEAEGLWRVSPVELDQNLSSKERLGPSLGEARPHVIKVGVGIGRTLSVASFLLARLAPSER